jgi:von Willebrand factor type D domain/Cadherin-like domain
LSNGSRVANGTILTLEQLQSLVFAPTANANGAAGTFSYTVSDGQGGTAAQAVTINITPGTKGGSAGDPHIFTFDGLHYDFQGQGDFVLVRAVDSELEVQVRQTPWELNRDATINTGLATVVDGNRVEIYADQSRLLVNGLQLNLNIGQSQAIGKGSISRSEISGYGLSGDLYTLTYTNGDVLSSAVYSGFLIDPTLNLAGSHQVAGLLGNNNGIADDDLALSDGTVLANPLASETLYGSFADSWRVAEGHSLFGSSAISPDTQLAATSTSVLGQRSDLSMLIQNYVFGGNGDDTLIGADIAASTSQNRTDIFMGNKGADTFVLGDRNAAFYVGAGQQDYALITDLWAEDRIQLHGNPNEYVLGAAPAGLANGTGIFLAAESNDLVGIIQGITVDKLNLLDASTFHFV